MAEPDHASNSPDRPPEPGVPPLPNDQPTTHHPQRRLTPEDTLNAIRAAGDVEPDDSPTIISRLPRRPGKPDEAITATLRGRMLAHFELLEPVGVGGMAAVIRAQDKQLDRVVALKILPPQMAADPESIRRFHQEARSAARLDHENIARVFYCGEDQGLHFIAFEFVEGDNLRQLLEKRGRLPVSEAVHYVLQVATGLAHAAARGVVHRDIKPSNIIVTPNGRAKLVDMGLARSLGPQVDGDLTQSGVTLGTFDYISPEQAIEPRDADVRSDIYSLGCTFYHMVTGQPPVPEGTAAKKLHHHERVPPIDPRQLNPEIPDDVAAVLARMMAKDPAGRYQKPEHLVQHLMHLAQKLGCQLEVPEAVLFVDAPLPGPPRSRPLLVASIATVLVVGLVLLLGSLPGGAMPENGNSGIVPPRVNEQPLNGTEKPKTQVGPDNPRETDPPPVVDPIKWAVARTPRELVQLLKQRVARIRLAADVFDLRAEEGATEMPGLLFRGEELVLEPADPNKRPTILLKHDPSIGTEQQWVALTVRGGKATLTGLRFEINATGTGTPVSALAVKDGGTLVVRNCEFEQSGFAANADQRNMSSLFVPALATSGSTRPAITLDRCFFKGGDEAVRLAGGAHLQAVNCAFGPHTALFRCRSARGRDTDLALTNCSGLLEPNAAVFRLDNGVTASLSLSHCVFSCPQGGEGDGAVLVRQTGERASDFQYDAPQPNVFHNFACYLDSERNQPAQIVTLKNFKKAQGVAGTDRSVDLGESPWQQDRPLTLMAKDPKQAFRVSLRLAELRQEKEPRKRVLGVERCTFGKLYDDDLPPAEEKPLGPVVRKVKIVDTAAQESGQGIYPTLGQALGDARPGDVILIKHNGLMAVEPVRLEKPNVDLVIKPHSRYRPILTLGPASDADASLFRIHDGKVQFEDLEFHLQPRRSEFKGQSVVALIGDGQCLFKNCLATLEPAKEVPLSFVVLADPSTVMKMEPQPPRERVARVRLENCFVRGDGSLMEVRASRPFALEIEDSLVALEGSLLVVDGNPKEAPSKPAATVSLKQVTAYLADHLILLRAGKDEAKPGLVPTQVVQATHCVFHSARANKPLVRLDGVDSDEQMKRIFSWGEGKQNVYSGFAQLLDQHPRSADVMPLPPYDQEKWETFTPRDVEHRFERARFVSQVPDRSLSKMWATGFKMKTPDMLKSGAPVERLPRPSTGAEPEPSGDGE